MIEKISRKEYKRLKELQKNGFHTELLFVLPDDTPYRCTTKAAAGLKEIMKFRTQKRLEEKQKQELDLFAI